MTSSHHSHIRPYQKNDRTTALLAFKSNVPDFFTIPEIQQFETWLDKFDNPSSRQPEFQFHYFILTLNERLIGCGGFVHDQEKNECRFAWGFVDRAFHKKGFGKVMFDFRLNKIKQLFPTAAIKLDTTQHSYTFFEKYGFVTEKYTADGYTTGMHRYDMKLQED